MRVHLKICKYVNRLDTIFFIKVATFFFFRKNSLGQKMEKSKFLNTPKDSYLAKAVKIFNTNLK